MKREFNKYVQSLSEKELKAELKMLYDKFDMVKKYYEMDLGADSGRILEDYKERIKKEYFPTRGYGNARSSVSRKVVSDFRKIAVHQSDLITLMLYRVEMMIKFTLAYGDMEISFYDSIANGMDQACKLIAREKLENHFKDYCQNLRDNTYELGYGMFDELNDIFVKYFN